MDYAHLSLRLGDAGKAIKLYTQVMDNHPDNAVLMGFVANAYLQSGQYHDAVNVLGRAVTLQPDEVTLLVSMSAALIYLGKYDEANKYLLRAVTLDPENASIHANLAITLSRLGNYEDALSHAKKSIEFNPRNAHIYHVAGNCLVEMGCFEEAEQYLLKVIELEKFYAPAYTALARTKKFNENDVDFISGVEELLTRQELRDEDRVHIEFALGKMYDDCKQWDKAFLHYHSANAQLSRDGGCDIQADIMNLNKVVFTPRTIEKLKEHASSSEKPVF